MLQAFISGMIDIGGLGFKAWHEKPPKHKSDLQTAELDPLQKTPSHSLLRGLLLICVLYQAFAWLHSSWYDSSPVPASL